ncbi:MAG: ferritin-like domain-containing protein [Flavobacteriales bacterium]
MKNKIMKNNNNMPIASNGKIRPENMLPRTLSASAGGLRKLFLAELKDIYWAEKALTKALPKMIKKATSAELSDALSEHLESTKEHVNRLQEVFLCINERAIVKKCYAMEGLIHEASEIMEETEEGWVRDAGIISASQKIEHYEIATYGTLRAFAHALGETEAANLLQLNLVDEQEVNIQLTEIAESYINAEAAGDDEDPEQEEVPIAKTTKSKTNKNNK